jgi:DNA-binding response OmpR family regulator
MMKHRILFVDDERKLLDGVQRTLADQSDRWDLHFATSGREALAQLQSASFDVAVLDYKMPGQDGLSLLADIKRDPKLQTVEVVMLTGFAEDSTKQQALALGATDLLNKPIIREDLLARLNNVLRLKSYQDDLRQRNQELQQQLLQTQRIELVSRLGTVATQNLELILSAMVEAAKVPGKVDSPQQYTHRLRDQINPAALNASKLVHQITLLTRGAEQLHSRCRFDELMNNWLLIMSQSGLQGYQVQWKAPETPCWVEIGEATLSQMILNLLLIASRLFAHRRKFRLVLKPIRSRDFARHFERDEARPFWHLRLQGPRVHAKAPANTTCHFKPLQAMHVHDGSLGMNLWAIQQIVTAHDGLLHIESSPEVGDFLDLYFPRPE